MTEITKETRIKNEFNRIKIYFDDIAEDKRAIITPLLQEAAFMRITLEDLQQTINLAGVTDHYQNGANQHGIKQSAELQAYNSLIKNYASVIKTLTGMLPYKTKVTTPAPWEYKPTEKTPEEIEAEREAEERKIAERKKEMELADEYQRQQREAGNPHSFPSFSMWKAQNGY